MFEGRWWGISLSCPKCKADTTLQLMAYSADGEFRLTFYCVDCRETIQWRVFASQLAHRAMLNDMEKQTPIVPATRVLRPPILPKPEKVTEDDRKFLEDFGISPDSF